MLSAAHSILRTAVSPALIERGCVQVIGLEEIKAEIGPGWEKRKEKVWAHLEALLAQKLGPTDFFIQIDETSFLVSMPTAQEQEAQIFCLRVAHDLHDTLLGRSDTGKLRISRVSSVDDDLLQTVLIAPEAMRGLAKQAGIQIPSSFAQASGEENAKPSAPPPFLHKFLPLWDAQKEAVTTFRVTSSLAQGTTETKALNAHARLEVVAAVSRIGEATRKLAGHLSTGERFMVWIPLSYDVLASPIGRMEIAGVCRGLSSDLRPYLIFEISDLPLGVPQSRLTELVGSLRPFCRGVAALLPARTVNFNAYLGAGLQAIGLSFAAGGGAEISGDIIKLCQAAQRQHIISFVLDVPHGELLQSARAIGLNLLSSPLIGESLDDPGPVRRLSALNIPKGSARPSVAA